MKIKFAILLLMSFTMDCLAEKAISPLHLPEQCLQQNASFDVLASCAENNFAVGAEPINPLIIKELLSWASDSGDQIHSINLIDSQHANRFFIPVTDYDVKKKGSFFEVSINKEGLFKYAVEGKTANGIYVIRTWDNTGGTLTLQNLLFLRVKQDHALNLDNKKEEASSNTLTLTQNILLLEKLGDLPLGQLRGLGNLSNADRAQSTQTVTVTGNTVTIETTPFQSKSTDKKTFILNIE